MFDTTQLTRTTSKKNLKWRDPSLTFIWLRANGPIVAAHIIADKIHLLTSCGDDDAVLAVRKVGYPTHQEVMVVDDMSAALLTLRGDD